MGQIIQPALAEHPALSPEGAGFEPLVSRLEPFINPLFYPY